MKGVVFLVLVVGSMWTLHTDPLIGPVTTMEDFNFQRFTGRWYEAAVVSTCPHYMQRKKRNPIIVALELKHVPTQQNFTMTSSTFRNGTCRETLTVFRFTSIPGRFFHHVARLGADVDSFVIHTSYDEYALILQLSTEKPSGNQTTIVKLYSRTVNASPLVLEKFKALIRHHGMNEDAAIMNQLRGECFRGLRMNEATATTPEISRQNIPTEEKQSDL